jgi:hypothetical protein
MVNFYYQCTEQVTEDQWKRRTSHVTIACPEIELLLSKGNMVIDAVIAAPPQTSEQGESPATDRQQLREAIALLRRWIGAVDGNWQISEITDDTRDFLEQRAAVCQHVSVN